MLRAQMVLIVATSLLAGCGEVIVFGHTVREGHSTYETQPESTAASASASSASVSASSSSSSSSLSANAFSSAVNAANASSSSVAATTSVTPSTAVHRVGAVTLAVATPAADKIANDANFNTDALLDAIKSELKSRGLLDNNTTSDAMEVSINHYALQPSTNAVLFGYTLNTGTLTGDVQVSDQQGKPLQGYKVEAEARVNLAEDGTNKNALHSLYRQFAIATADALAGTPRKSNTSAD